MLHFKVLFNLIFAPKRAAWHGLYHLPKLDVQSSINTFLFCLFYIFWRAIVCWPFPRQYRSFYDIWGMLGYIPGVMLSKRALYQLSHPSLYLAMHSSLSLAIVSLLSHPSLCLATVPLLQPVPLLCHPSLYLATVPRRLFFAALQWIAIAQSPK